MIFGVKVSYCFFFFMHTQIVFFNIDERGFSLIAYVSKTYIRIQH